MQGPYKEHSGDLVEPLGRTAVIGEVNDLLERVKAVMPPTAARAANISRWLFYTANGIAHP